MNPTNMVWQYETVKSNALNVHREPGGKIRHWNNMWPMNRLMLVELCVVCGWYETLYRGEPAYVMADFIKLLNESVVILYMIPPSEQLSYFAVLAHCHI